eukprot:2674707-Rhodomonas_salina.1
MRPEEESAGQEVPAEAGTAGGGRRGGAGIQKPRTERGGGTDKDDANKTSTCQTLPVKQAAMPGRRGPADVVNERIRATERVAESIAKRFGESRRQSVCRSPRDGGQL